MRNFTLTLAVIFTCLLLCTASVMASGVPQDGEVLGDTTITYYNVDVVVECEWTDSESNSAVDAAVTYVGSVAVKVSLSKRGKDRGEYRLFAGMVIKLYDHESGELIHVFTGTRLPS